MATIYRLFIHHFMIWAYSRNDGLEAFGFSNVAVVGEQSARTQRFQSYLIQPEEPDAWNLRLSLAMKEKPTCSCNDPDDRLGVAVRETMVNMNF